MIGHLNHMPVTHVYGQLVDIIRARNFAPSRSTTCSSPEAGDPICHSCLNKIIRLFGAPNLFAVLVSNDFMRELR